MNPNITAPHPPGKSRGGPPHVRPFPDVDLAAAEAPDPVRAWQTAWLNGMRHRRGERGLAHFASRRLYERFRIVLFFEGEPDPREGGGE